MSVIQLMTPTRRKRRHAARTRLPDVPVEDRQRNDRSGHRNHTEHHRGQLQHRRRGDKSRVDVDACGQSRLGGHLEVGEDTGDLRLLLRREGACGAGNPDEVGADLPDVGPDMQRAAGTRGHRGALGHCGHGVAERDEHHVGSCPDEQAALRDVSGFFRHGGQDQAALGGQRGDGLAGDRDIEGLRSTRNQRGGDVGDHAVRAGGLRPGDGGGGLLDRKQRDQGTQQHPGDARDYGDEPGDGVNPRPLRLVAWHEGRC